MYSISIQSWRRSWYVFFFFQAEDGIRYLTVTGVQTCALPILAACPSAHDRGESLRDAGTGEPVSVCAASALPGLAPPPAVFPLSADLRHEIGRASCRERV